MQVSRIAFDGLWRCLCPSFDAISASKSVKPLRRASTRPRLYPAQKSSRSVLTYSIHGSTSIGLEEQDRTSESVECVETFKAWSPIAKASSRNTTLDDVPIKELYDKLRNIGTNDHAYKSITKLVDYLITSRGEEPCLPLYDALIRANADARNGSADAVVNLLREVKEENVVPDANLYHSALQALAIHPDYLTRVEVLREMKNRWHALTTDGWHYLIVGLLRDRQYEVALDKLEHMQREDIRVHPWLYDIFIYLFCEAQELDVALKILQRRVNKGDMDISPNVWFYVLDACSANYHYPGTKYVWQKRVETSYVNPPDGICMNVLNTAARNKDPILAVDVVKVLTERNTKLDLQHYEALISTYANSSGLKNALQILNIMKKARLEPTEATTRPIFEYLSKMSDPPSEVLKTLQAFSQSNEAVPIAAVNVMIEASIVRREMKEAIKQYKAIHEICPSGSNTATFNVLLQGCAKNSGNKVLAMFLASEMAALGIRPDVLTYDRLVLVCIEDDNYEDAFRYLEEMKTVFEGSELRPGTFNALIRKCVTAGDVRSWELLDDMHNKGHDVENIRKWAEKSWNGGINADVQVPG